MKEFVSWRKLQKLWDLTAPSELSENTCDQSLLRGDWVSRIDHTIRAAFSSSRSKSSSVKGRSFSGPNGSFLCVVVMPRIYPPSACLNLLLKVSGMSSQEAKQLKELEKENARLKRLLAEKELDIDMLKEVSRGNF